MVITVFGLGFVGLTTALVFAEKGIKVYGTDTDREKLKMITEGVLPFNEPEMAGALFRNLGRTFFPVEFAESAISESSCIFYCVGTPSGGSGAADLSCLLKAIDNTLALIKDDSFRVLVIKSTVPPSTVSSHIAPHVQKRAEAGGMRIGLANNPEFLREGHCWNDLFDADRIVIGCSDERSEKMLRELYSGFDAPLYAVSNNTAEYIKYLSNALLATMISFSNEMSVIADKIGGINTAEAFRILHKDRRWADGSMSGYVYPGCGYGGYCLPKDTKALCSHVTSIGYQPQILKSVIEMNDSMPKTIADKIICGRDPGIRIGILGLSFKPGSSDVRDTPAAKIIKQLLIKGYKNISAYDPCAAEEFKKRYDLDIEYCSEISTICGKSDILAIITAWPQFKDIIHLVPEDRIIDCRYLL
jgi:UDPglucose 6-dehydrogenase